MQKEDSTTGINNHTRQSNIELLRILTIIAIVAHHFAVHGGFEYTTENISINSDYFSP